ncbi:MAG: type III restriction endonuclease subunit R [Comamonadaceae bacterium CG1_02_60_18]|nr:MAG: type III restriction endonuclease subunit R [Comamonadaceae bacterium CG1_02_60_18]PIQ56423.1 MAG: type III restriction endonuclease subunit R [Comamonadaceae bacterium CG12_big_fil_rev_8_21_14_0_65_59_15]
MTTLTLKSYQQAALDSLTAFARSAQLKGPALAFGELSGRAYNPEPFAAVPCVCLRIPTGGGKTIMAAHAVPLLARQWLASDAPVVLWLVPSDTIRSQALKCLQTAGHPYREALVAAYGAGVQVCELDDVAQIAPSDWGQRAVIVVATIQSFRIDDTDKRNVYSFSERFERHFQGCTQARLQVLHGLPDAVVTADEAAADSKGGILKSFAGQPRWSLVNWLALHEPIVIVDEAHNTKTDKSFTALKRLNPNIILELTATPVPGKTNVLYHVSAQELAAESMVKLPIALAEHPQGWPQAVFAAVQTQNALEAEALKDEAAGNGYLRPIVLFQAQNVNDEVPPEALRLYLQDELHIPVEHIVVATGDTRELDGLDLSARTCPVRFVITVQALREGWDCPFAYVLCSLQKLSSATAVEQLLGRVLRMPYAKRRGREALNKAYAHVCEAQFSSAAHELADRLINHMGFEALDVASMIVQQASLPLFESNQALAHVEYAPVATVFEAMSASPELLGMAGVSAVQVAGSASVQVNGPISAELETALLAQVRGAKKQAQVRDKVAEHNALVCAQAAPASRGAQFAPVPGLAYRTTTQGQLWPLEREAVLETLELDLLTPDAVQLPGFHVVEQSNTFEIYLKDAHVQMRAADANQIAFDYGSSTIAADDLVRWLDQSLFQKLPEFTQTQRRSYFAAVVNHLLNEKGLSLVALAKARFKLAQDIEAHVGDLKDRAAKTQFRQLVLEEAWQISPDWQHPLVFEPNRYPAPAGSRYPGRYQFAKHFYPVLADLKDGGEEFACAQLLDHHPAVKHWVRNLDTAPCGFGLATSRGRFYPDFVAELTDGRIAVIEYKGAHLLNDPYEIEKRQVGELWARTSGGRCVFGYVVKDRAGVGLADQLNQLLNN